MRSEGAEEEEEEGKAELNMGHTVLEERREGTPEYGFGFRGPLDRTEVFFFTSTTSPLMRTL